MFVQRYQFKYLNNKHITTPREKLLMHIEELYTSLGASWLSTNFSFHCNTFQMKCNWTADMRVMQSLGHRLVRGKKRRKSLKTWLDKRVCKEVQAYVSFHNTANDLIDTLSQINASCIIIAPRYWTPLRHPIWQSLQNILGFSTDGAKSFKLFSFFFD